MTGAGREQHGRLLAGRGPRALEGLLLARLTELRDAARAQPRRLALPVRVVVPSRALRLHLATRITRALGPSAGIQVQTLHGLAAEVLERARVPAAASDEWIEILVRRHARRTPALAESLEGFEDGFRAVVSSVRDLLDAGFEAPALEAVRECLEGTRAGARERRRLEGLLAVAARVATAIERSASGGSGTLLARARDVLERDPARLPTRALLVHGFVDVTGRAAELIQSLLTRLEGVFLLDLPDDPLTPGRIDAGARFGERLRTRVEGVLGSAGEPAPAASAPPAELFRAPGPEAEAREVARRIRIELARGVEPERIAIVARDLGPYGTPLRRHLTRLGVPFSGLRARAPLDGPGRRLAALADLLAAGGEFSSERWLDCVGAFRVEREGRSARRAPTHELRLGLRVAGITRLEEAASRVPELVDDRLALPRRRGVLRDPPPGVRPTRSTVLVREKVPGDELRAARRAAAALLARLARWPASASLSEHLERLSRLRHRDLGWRAGDRAEQLARAALDPLAESPLAAEELTREEFAALARRALVAGASPLLGGAGGGVQVLDVMEARGRTFEHLFLIGLNRDVFPRVVQEDPLLSDTRRRALESLLPDVPVKGRGRLEDRFLFAQLLASAERRTLSWPMCDDEGKRKVVSPLVERLLAGRAEDDLDCVPALFAERVDDADPRAAAESAVLQGLAGEREERAQVLELCYREAGLEGDLAALAGARARVLAAWERGPLEPRALAPWLGFLGPQAAVGARPDPEREPTYVTLVEAVARCPWQAVLTRVLRLEEGYEALEGAGRIDPRAVGNVVHAFLERLARAVLGPDEEDMARALARPPLRVPWPEPERFEALLLEVARAAFAPARPSEARVRWLAERARPHLAQAREILEREAALGGGVLGVEVQGRAQVAAEGRAPFELAFRADRVERVGEELVLTDFKTGAPLGRAKLRKEGIPRGTHLQPLAYVLAGRTHDPDARGRYLHLTREAAEEDHDVGIGAGHAAAESDLVGVLTAVFGAWREGVFFPRLYDEKKDREPDACRLCGVSQACLRGDSGARMALVGWTERPLGATPAEEALGALWQLAQATREEKGKA